MKNTIKIPKEATELWNRSVPYIQKAIPFLLIFAATLIPFWFWIDASGSDYITYGQDIGTHLNLVWDLVYGFEHGFFCSTNHIYMGLSAYNTSLFYGMLPHYCAAILKYLFSFAGMKVIDAIKTVSVIASFIGVFYTYKLIYRMTGSKCFGLAGACAFSFFPYRLYCFFYRFAWSESVAMSFIPMVFYGVYRIIFDKDTFISPFITTVCGFALLVFTHPFTTVLTFFSVLVFALVNLKAIISRFKKAPGRLITYTVISVILELGLVFVFVFPMLKALSSGMYRVSDNDMMWTTPDALIGHLNLTNQYSGFLDFSWLDQFKVDSATDTKELWRVGLYFFPASCIAVLIVDFLLCEHLKKRDPFFTVTRIILAALVLFIPSVLISMRKEIMLAEAFFYLFYVLKFIIPWPKNTDGSTDIDDAMTIKNTKEIKEGLINAVKEPGLYACLCLIFLGFLFLYTEGVWKHAPYILCLAQFPFRFWSITGFLLIMLAAYIFKPFRKSKIAGVVAVTAGCFLLTISSVMPDKRLWSIGNSQGKVEEPTQESVMSVAGFGTENEYMPIVFKEISEGKVQPEYPNSLAVELADEYSHWGGKLFYGEEQYFNPVYLEGSGTAVLTYMNTPDVTFDISADSESLLQIPQFWYEGYKAVAVYPDGTTENCSLRCVDGLVAAYIPEGDYQLRFTYPGMPLKNVGWVLFGISSAATIAFAIYGTVYMQKKRKEEKEREPASTD